jgi:hypothetical protein
MTESIGSLYNTQIPSYSENADVQAAFRLYHYGSTDYNTANTNTANLINPSIAYTLNNLQTQINAISPLDVSIIDAKGDLLVGSANNTADNLPVGSNNYVLTADSTQTLGIKWAALDTTLTNTATFTNKTLTSPIINGLGVIFEGTTDDAFETTLSAQDPTSDRSIVIPNESGTLALKDLSFNTQTGTTYTFVLTDSGKLVTASNASSQTYSIPTNASVAFPIGTQIHLVQYGIGQVTVNAASSGTTTVLSSAVISTQPKTRVQYSSITCVKMDTNTWLVIGDIE